MSKGYGKIQRRIIEILERAPHPVPTRIVAVKVFMSNDDLDVVDTGDDSEIETMALLGAPLSNSQRNAVSRALNGLWRDCAHRPSMGRAASGHGPCS